MPLFLASCLFRSLMTYNYNFKSNAITMARARGLAPPRSLLIYSKRTLKLPNSALSFKKPPYISKPTLEMSTLLVSYLSLCLRVYREYYVAPAKISTSEITVHAQIRVQKRRVPRFSPPPSAGASWFTST